MDIDTFIRSKFDPASALRDPLGPPVHEFPEFPIAKGFAYRQALPAVRDPSSNMYLESIDEDSEIRAVWTAICVHAFRSEPVLRGVRSALNATIDAEGNWRKLVKSGESSGVLDVLAFRVKALLARCRGAIRDAAASGVGFTDTRTGALPRDPGVLDPSPTWWILRAGGIDLSVEPATLRAVRLGDFDTWAAASRYSSSSWHDLDQDALVVGVAPAKDEALQAFAVATATAGQLPRILTRSGPIFR